jgi:hypothetical protein
VNYALEEAQRLGHRRITATVDVKTDPDGETFLQTIGFHRTRLRRTRYQLQGQSLPRPDRVEAAGQGPTRYHTPRQRLVSKRDAVQRFSQRAFRRHSEARNTARRPFLIKWAWRNAALQRRLTVFSAGIRGPDLGELRTGVRAAVWNDGGCAYTYWSNFAALVFPGVQQPAQQYYLANMVRRVVCQ